MNNLKISDVSLRDGFQSLFGGKARTSDLAMLAGLLDDAGYYFIEVIGGASFDIMHRVLNEDPWERIRTLGRYLKKTPMAIMLRGKNLVGYHPYPDDVIDAFIDRSASNGIKIFRVFDPLNYTKNLEKIAKKIKSENLHFQPMICFSLTSDSIEKDEVYNFEYYLEKAKEYESMGADSITIKDTSGILSPYDAYRLIKNIKLNTKIPVGLHSHSTCGFAPMTHIKAVEAGADFIDTCIAPLAGRNSHPAVEPLFFSFIPKGLSMNIEKIMEAGQLAEKEILPKYRQYLDEDRLSLINSRSLKYKLPPALISSILNILKDNNIKDKLDQILLEFQKTRKSLGNIPVVAPLTQLLATQAVNNFLFDKKKSVLSSQTIKLIKGFLGKTPAKPDTKLTAMVREKYPDQESDSPLDLEEAARNIKGFAVDIEDELVYALFPATGKRFLKWKYKKETPPEETYPVSLEDAMKRLKHLKNLKEGRLDDGEVDNRPEKGPGTRSFNVFVDDEFFEVLVDPKDEAVFYSTTLSQRQEVEIPAQKQKPASYISVEEKTYSPKKNTDDFKKTPEKENKSNSFFLKSPMPGSIVSLRKKTNDRVKKGEIIIILEAMKMKNPLRSPVDGIIMEIRCSGGEQVPKDSVLCIIDIDE